MDMLLKFSNVYGVRMYGPKSTLPPPEARIYYSVQSFPGISSQDAVLASVIQALAHEDNRHRLKQWSCCRVSRRQSSSLPTSENTRSRG